MPARGSLPWQLHATTGTRGRRHDNDIQTSTHPDFRAELIGGIVFMPSQQKEALMNNSPELIAEVSSSTESIDLHAKKHDYEKAGVREYVVWRCASSKCFGLSAIAANTRTPRYPLVFSARKCVRVCCAMQRRYCEAIANIC
jgi:hypothetical protein